MKKPDFIGLATQTWKEMRRFPTSDALADAVLIKALYGLLMTPFSFQRYFPLKKSKWNGLLLLSKILLTPFALFWSFNLSSRLRRNEKKAWRTTIIHSSVFLWMASNSLFCYFLLKNGPRELTEKNKESMTEEQINSYETTQEQWRNNPKKPLPILRQSLWFLVSVGLTLNVLFRALQPTTRARFRSKS